MVDVVGLPERQPRVAAVDARAAGIDQVLHRVVPARLEDVEEAGDVRADVLVRIRQRVAHAGLRREVDDAIEAFLREQRVDRGPVGDVELVEREVGVLELLQPRELEVDVVVLVEVVESDHGVAAREQALRDVHADETGGAGDEDFHSLLPRPTPM